MSKHQGAIATSTYSTEFCAMRLAPEEAITIRCMLRSLGIPVTKPTKLFGDNTGVIQNASMPEATLQKKHTDIFFTEWENLLQLRSLHPMQSMVKIISPIFSPSKWMGLPSNTMLGICCGKLQQVNRKCIENIFKQSISSTTCMMGIG